MDMLDFRLETFLDLCHSKSYTKTAGNLHITQPAVSQHIRYLEQYYGVKLILYQNHQFSLTPEGTYLFKEISELRIRSQEIRDNVQNLSSIPNIPVIRIGTNPTIGEFILPRLISAYTQKHPDRRISSSIGSSEQLEQQLLQGEIDFCITDCFDLCPEMAHRLFRREPVCCVCNSTHPLAGQSVSLSRLQAENIVYREKDSHAYDILKNAFTRLGYDLDTFNISLETGSMYSCIQYLKNSQSISFLYRCAVEESLGNNDLALIHVKEYNEAEDFYCVYPGTLKAPDVPWDFLEFCLTQQML